MDYQNDKKLKRRKVEQVGIELRIRGFSWLEIAQVLLDKHGIGVSPNKLQKIVDRAVGRSPVPNANTLRVIEDRRLDIVTKEMMAMLAWQGEPDDDERPTFSDKLRASIMVQKISERRSNLNGLNLQATVMSIGMVGAQKDAADIQMALASFREEADEPKAIEVDSQSC